MSRFVFIVFLFSASFAVAQEHLSADDFAGFTESLSAKVGANNGAILANIVDEGNYFATVVYREPGPGESESHRDWADIYFVASGSATLVTGGTIVNAEDTAVGEIRGSAIADGQSRQLAKGDVVHIPAGVPHHVIVNAGEEITYFIIKVQASSE